MPFPGYSDLERTLYEALNHIRNAGAFNEGQPNQVTGDQLPPEIKQRVDSLAAARDSLKGVPGAEAQVQALQDSINNLYNPRLREGAASSWAQLRGDENNPWSATGGNLQGAASIVNPMTTDPDHNYYGGRRK